VLLGDPAHERFDLLAELLDLLAITAADRGGADD
jgi:hypothetical protein